MTKLFSFGAVTGSHGLSGELKVLSISEHPSRFLDLPGKDAIWRRGDEMRVLSVNAVRPMGRFYILEIDGLESREEAQSLAGGELVVPESELLPLPEGHYYLHQLVGLQVIDRHEGNIGRIKEVLQPGSNDVYVVEGPLGEILVPALKSVVEHIDLRENTMKVVLPEGLLEPDED